MSSYIPETLSSEKIQNIMHKVIWRGEVDEYPFYNYLQLVWIPILNALNKKPKFHEVMNPSFLTKTI